jgi:hypothetical protein
MSRLYFAPLEDAFYLRSDNIKDTQKEIDNLKQIINSSQLEKRIVPSNEVSKAEDGPKKRTLMSDPVTAQFGNVKENNDMDILKIIHSPKFEEIIKNYIIVKRPEWINRPLQSTSYQTSTFGNRYSSTFYSNVTNYLLFFVIALIVYFLLEKFFKS